MSRSSVRGAKVGYLLVIAHSSKFFKKANKRNENSGERVVFLTSKTMDFLEFVLWVYPSDSMSTGNLVFKKDRERAGRGSLNALLFAFFFV